MEPKSAMEIFFSPEGLLILPFAAVIDIIGIVLVCFALDDFWITDIIAWTFIGSWGMFRSQFSSGQSAEIQMPSIGEKQKMGQEIRSAQSQKAQKMAKGAKTAKNIKWLEFIPYVGALPLWTISVYMTIKYS